MVAHAQAALGFGAVAVLAVTDLYFQLREPRSLIWLFHVGAVALAALISNVLVYRLVFHPLAKYPGPLVAACTDWYTVYWIASGERHLELYRQHQKHGKHVRFGPSRLSINSANASKDLHNTSSNTFKSPAYGSFRRFFGAEMSLTTTDHSIHAFRRRVNAKALTPAAVKALEDRVTPHVNYLVEIIKDSFGTKKADWSPGHDMSERVALCIADIMGDVTFSHYWNVQRDPENRHFVHDLPKGVAGIHLVGHMQSLFMFNIHSYIFGELIRGVTSLMELSRKFANERQYETSSGDDIWSHLLDSKDPKTGRGFTQEELTSEASLFVIGGTDGMISSVTATLFYLVHNPHTLERLTREIRDAFPAEQDGSCPIRFASRELQSITYLVACIDEAMRISPPVPSILPRIVGPGGIVVDGEFFPEGIDLGIPHYAMHRDPEYFPDPLTYKPERWMQSQTTQGRTMTPGTGQAPSFTPFGAGRSSCIGKHMAYQEMSYIIARLIWQFDLRLDVEKGHIGEGSGKGKEGRERKDEFQLHCHFVSHVDGPVVQFKQRSDVLVAA
ncbi:cytochrome P450 [Xylaria sp. CBS 124048]|nr:cytochrome P450 [Xylaria sp. CBS 124048]